MDVNVNLLIALDVLLEERNLRRAASRQRVTQSAMSHTLRQLRDAIGDPLLVRSGNQMVLTARAEAIRGPLRRALSDLSRAIAIEPTFSPTESDRCFRVVASDASAVTLMPRIAELCATVAPRIKLHVALYDASARALECGEADLLIGPSLPEAPGLQSRFLYSAGFVVLCRAGHPRVAGGIDLDTYCELPHVVVGRRDTPGVVDVALEALGRRRHIAVKVPYFFAAPAFVENTDYLLTLPTVPAHYFAAKGTVQCVQAPIRLPTVRVQAFWHERVDDDPGHQWFRSLIATAARSLERDERSPAVE
jgi:DNA-binding transcriptional LysR family regulator